VAKTLSGSQGVGVMICKDAEQTNTSLESFHKLEVDVLLQRYIESGAKDIRVIVVGDKVVSAMRRTGKKDFRANISQGGSGEAVELSEADQALCIKASQVLGLEFSGVDLIKDQDENSYVVEVNGNPGSKIIDITGYNYFQDLVTHIEKKVGASTRKEETQQEDSNSSKAQLASLELKQERGEKMSINEVALMGTLRRMVKVA
jgi:ribosomal protein S6--L-glutamate ligase